MQYEEIKQSCEFGYQRIMVIEDINYYDSSYSDIVWMPNWNQIEVREHVTGLLLKQIKGDKKVEIYYKLWMRPIGLTCIEDIKNS